MKRILAFSLLVVLLLGGCAQQATQPTTQAATEAPATEAPTTEAPTTDATTATDATTPAEAASAEPAPAASEVLYRHPLTGKPLDAPFTGRPVAVSIGNTSPALPQYGIAQTDMLLEVEAEGSVTRFLAFFTELDDVDSVGPVRSVRTYFNSVAASLQAPVVHCGGSKRGVKGYHDQSGSKVPDWMHVNQFFNAKYFRRDTVRKADRFAMEHTLFTSGAQLKQLMVDKKFDPIENLDYRMHFAENTVPEGESAKQITFTFQGTKTSNFTYDEANGFYTMKQYGGQDLMDGNIDDRVTFKNLLMIYAQKNYTYYVLVGSGEGYYAANGKIVKIEWKREKLDAPFEFFYEDGTPLTLDVGNAYFGISGKKARAIKYE